MGCFSDSETGPPEESAKWDLITLSDFRCTSAWTIVAYVWLWCLAMVGVAVYVVDTYTAVNLLAFDEWTSQVQPKLDFKYSKWIFAVCILLSWALFFYELIRAIRVIRRRGVAESFLDPLAVNIQSMRPRGFKRFLVFTELTKSKKGADYVALFVYFNFKSPVRIILAEGPRQAVNAMTLYALLTAELIGNESHERNNFDQFWWNVEQIANKDKREAIIYFTMLFTFVIYVFSAICLILSAILYIFFLWHYIPHRDGRLSVYCKRKIDRRLAKIVEYKVKAAIEEEERKTQKAERKAELKRQKTGEMPPPVAPYLKKQPTLPNLGDSPELEKKGDTMPEFPLARQNTSNTMATLPPYSTTDNSDMSRQPTFPQIDDTNYRRPIPTRNPTAASQWSEAPSYRSETSLLANAGYAGDSEDVPLPPSAVTRQDSYASVNAPVHRPMGSQSSMGSVRSGQVRHFPPGPPGSRAQPPVSANPYGPGPHNGPMYPRQPPQPRIPLPVRSNTGMFYEQDPNSASTFASSQDGYRSYGPPARSNTADGYRQPPLQQSQSSFSALHSQTSFSRPMPRKPSNQSFTRAYTPATVPEDQSASPDSYEMLQSPSHTLPPPPPPKDNSRVAFNQSAHSATQGPHRNITVTHGAPASGTRDYFGQVSQGIPQRSFTAPITPVEPQRASVGDILDGYGSSEDEGIQRPQAPHAGPPRSNTAGPGSHGQWQAY
ncbi:Low affinity K(+) transporter 1 [Fulvia fulva]|nr:Low affinity K(+) transporter 1 [Fulvia fulva]